MAFTKIPKDINKIETKSVGKFTTRQAIFMGISAILSGISFYILHKIDLNIAFYSVFIIAMPIMFLGFYKKNGEYLDKQLIRYLRRTLLNKEIRIYENKTYVEKIKEILGKNKQTISKHKQKRNKLLNL